MFKEYFLVHSFMKQKKTFWFATVLYISTNLLNLWFCWTKWNTVLLILLILLWTGPQICAIFIFLKWDWIYLVISDWNIPHIIMRWGHKSARIQSGPTLTLKWRGICHPYWQSYPLPGYSIDIYLQSGYYIDRCLLLEQDVYYCNRMSAEKYPLLGYSILCIDKYLFSGCSVDNYPLPG
jgi:hypothetical protein